MSPHTHTNTRTHTSRFVRVCGEGRLRLQVLKQEAGRWKFSFETYSTTSRLCLKSVLTVSVLRVNDAPRFYSPSNTSPNTQLFYSNMNHDSFNIWLIPNKEKCHHLLIIALQFKLNLDLIFSTCSALKELFCVVIYCHKTIIAKTYCKIYKNTGKRDKYHSFWI